MKTTTNIYHKNEFVRAEVLTTLEQYVRMGRLVPGQLILIGDIKVDGKEETAANTSSFWVGDCTKFHEISNSDGGFGWNENAPSMSKYVVEVHTYTSK